MKETILIILFISNTLIGQSQVNSSKIGQKAPPIEIENWIYPKIQIEDWHTKEVPKDLNGKVIVLDFWFTHCAPCVASIPGLNHLAKQFPEVVFLSVTFDKPDEINRFLDKMVIFYPVGSDAEQKTIKAYGVTGFPETFLIDKNGVIRWQGSPFQLDKDILNKVLGQENEMINLELINSELPLENSAYSFSIQKHTLEMGQSSYCHFYPFDIIVFNKDLENMLTVFYGINKSRILAQDSVFLKTTYDITLKADNEVTTQANCVEMLKFLLPENMKFDLTKVVKDTIVNIIEIENDSLLTTHVSNAQYLEKTIRYDNWEAKGATIENLKDFLENNHSKLISAKEADNRKFDFIISANDFEEAKYTLENEYGLILKPTNHKTEFWKIIEKTNK